VKLPAGARRLAQRAIGLSRARPITPNAVRDLEDVLVVGVGVVSAGSTDARLPGEQRAASLGSLARVLADVPRQRAIVLHCG
jgi:hypothetical protein